eukprot:5087019-Alexandrium_andersonii.AAC.2
MGARPKQLRRRAWRRGQSAAAGRPVSKVCSLDQTLISQPPTIQTLISQPLRVLGPARHYQC